MNYLFVLICAYSFIIVGYAKTVCYDDVGCYSDDAPFNNLPLPDDPKDIPPAYYRMRRGENVTLIQSPLELRLDRKLLILTHGWSGNLTTTDWLPGIVENLLMVNPDNDILFYDWGLGAALGSGRFIYHQPASNVRVVSKLLQQWITQSPDFNATNSHCIGFSLGAHLCGFFAKNLGQKLGRISAIDPAAPGFWKDDPASKVHVSDTLILDVTHGSWISPIRAMGHKDFYLNNARIQPGCSLRRKRRSVEESQFQRYLDILENSHDENEIRSITELIGDLFGCSHYRTAHTWAESIKTMENCEFLFCPCPTLEHFNKGHCRTCDRADGQLLGYRSDESENQGSFYGVTLPEEPYCIPNYR